MTVPNDPAPVQPIYADDWRRRYLLLRHVVQAALAELPEEVQGDDEWARVISTIQIHDEEIVAELAEAVLEGGL